MRFFLEKIKKVVARIWLRKKQAAKERAAFNRAAQEIDNHIARNFEKLTKAIKKEIEEEKEKSLSMWHYRLPYTVRYPLNNPFKSSDEKPRRARNFRI